MAKDLDTGKYERVDNWLLLLFILLFFKGVARFHQQQGVAHSLRNAIK